MLSPAGTGDEATPVVTSMDKVSGRRVPKSRASARDLFLIHFVAGIWLPPRDSNLRRLRGVSEAGDACRNPERRRGTSS
jgi:hypothetical protein